MCSKTSQSLDTWCSKFIFAIYFSLFIMNNQSRSPNQITANIQLQQPITTESIVNNPIMRPSLDERIKQMTAIPKTMSRPTTTQSSSIIDLTTSKKISTVTKPQEQATTTNLPSTSTFISPPALVTPKKSAHSFVQRFIAHNNDPQQPEHRKIASLQCDENPEKTINLYIFKEDKRPYEAANDYGKNKYKFGAGIVSYFSNVGKIPNDMKFDNSYQKQVWVHMLENIGTYNLYALLGKFDTEENIIIHNVNQGIDIYIGKLQGPIPLNSKRSLQAFELRGRNRNIIIQTFEKRSIIVIESIILGSE